ncbi:Abhydrolase domain-containing protein IMO32 [Hondaea fermentalgiana]|uniref:Abhydrolase domain-containing protein IMO32 n=1 Tax=Hondaea fermentalgiana TaxID=2315210 RepID=A0A2R5GF92_9STRA|nr:Abhydrolase domain-containing protein IMO32 [Hondaea fermentalgiana]|eukprot:GBG28408.1 Abhydrolase domain-containing protein IMO32 [Hondaea fermentalgiana]
MLALGGAAGRGLAALRGQRQRGSTTRGLAQQAAQLAHEILRSDKVSVEEGTPRKTAVVLHGILGNHKNLRQISTKLANAFPEYDMLLVTHRAHGSSERGEPPHTVQACSHDVLALLQDQGISAPEIVIGHSFGGKVSLGILESFADGTAPEGMSPPRDTWILDAPPGLWDREFQADKNALSQSVSSVIAALHDLPQPIESKPQLVKDMTARGFSTELAQWMTLNVRKAGSEGYRWSFDLDIIQQLFKAHTETDFWPLLEGRWLATHQECKVGFLQAERNDAWTDAIVQRFEDHPHPEQVHRVLIPKAGHWLHVEAPQLVFDALAPSFEE